MRLNQAVAIEKGAKSATEDAITAAYKAAQKPEPFAGLTRVYQPKDEEGDKLPGESQKIIATVPAIIDDFTAALSKLFDATAVKVYANTKAKADVVLDGKTILKDVPIEYLLFLEKRLTDVATFVGKLPTLDPAVNWKWDAANSSYVQDPPVVTNRTKKVPKSFVKAPATEKFAAQVDVFQEDEYQGFWTTTRLSGAVPTDTVKTWKTRILAMQQAVKMAREEANMAETTEVKTGKVIFDLLFAPIK